jgi:hypothetical protein
LFRRALDASLGAGRTLREGAVRTLASDIAAKTRHFIERGDDSALAPHLDDSRLAAVRSRIAVLMEPEHEAGEPLA